MSARDNRRMGTHNRTRSVAVVCQESNQTTAATKLQTSTLLRLEELAGKARLAVEAVEACLEGIREHELSALKKALLVGRYLKEVKSLLPHGEFQQWVRRNVPGSYSRASAYMRIAKRWRWLQHSERREEVTSIDAALDLIAEETARREILPLTKAKANTENSLGLIGDLEAAMGDDRS